MKFENSYAALPEKFFARVSPEQPKDPTLVRFNWQLGEELGMSQADWPAERLAAVFSGREIPAGADPIALAYAGHQFANFVPSLGDGRAVLLGEVIDRHGRRRDIQLKGSGRTPFSRQGDGKSPLGPAIREYIVSEAMHALGIPTTRSLAVVATGETIQRDGPTPAGVVTRVASSHLRIGTFQYFTARRDADAVRQLADYAILRLYPEVRDDENPYLALLEQVVQKQAALIAQWMGVGFVHGVMNTDNITLSGETIDYGPCAFIDHYDPAAVFSSIDLYGRYAYANQPAIAQWNLTRFAECLLPLIDENIERAIVKAQDVVNGFSARYAAAALTIFSRKLGILNEKSSEEIVTEFLDMMAAAKADFTSTFRILAGEKPSGPSPDLTGLLGTDPRIGKWHDRWMAARNLLKVNEALSDVNPVYIPRNHLVEEVIMQAVSGELAPLDELLEAVTNPYRESPKFSRLTQAPESTGTCYRTFCGT